MNRPATFWNASPWLKAGFAVLALVYLLLALLFVTERILQQQLPGYQQQLEAKLAETTGLQWSLEGLEIRFDRLNPIISARRISAATNTLAETEEESVTSVLQVERPQIYLDLTRSLLQRQPSFYGLTGQRVELLLDRQTGRWLIPGLQLPDSEGELDWQSLLRNLRYLSLAEIEILASDVIVEHMPVFAVDFQRQDEQRQLLIRQVGADGGRQPIMQFKTSGEPGQREFGLRAQVLTVEDSLSRWINQFFASSELGFIETELLLDKPAGQPLVGVANVGRASMALSNVAPAVSESGELADPPELVAQPFALLFEQGGDGKYAAHWPELEVELGGEPIKLQSGRLGWQRGAYAGGNLSLQMPKLNLDHLTFALSGSAIWAEIIGQRGVDAVRKLQASGMLHELDLRIPLLRPSSFELRSHFEQLSVQPYGNAPGGDGLSGKLSIAATAGLVQLDTVNPIALHFPSVYPDPLAFEGAQGSVEWLLDDSRILVSGEDLHLGSAVDDGRFHARFATNGRISGEEASTLTLEIGVEQARAENLLVYLPKTVSGGLKKWLDESNATGYVERGGFIYHGSLRRGEAGRRSVNLFFDLSDASLSYHPDWPAVSAMSGALRIANTETSATLSTAHTAGFDLAGADFSLSGTGVEQRIALDTSLAGDTGKLLEFLQQAPLSDALKSTLSGWRATGEFEEGRLSLQMPLVNLQQSDIGIDVELLLKDSALYMQDLGLSFSKINGPLAYSDSANLRSEALSAELWGEPISVAMGGRQLGGEISDISASGRVDIDNIRDWLNQPVLGFAQGSTDFDVALAIGGGASTIEASSDLRGISIDLPAPLSKQASGSLPLALSWSMDESGQPMAIALGDLARLTMGFSDFDFDGGTIELSADSSRRRNSPPASLPTLRDRGLYRSEHLTLTGAIERFNVTEWIPVIRRYGDMAAAADQAAGASEQGAAGMALAGREIQVGYTEFLDQPYYQTVVDFDSMDSRWIFRLENPALQGSISLPESLLEESPGEQVAEPVPAGTDSGVASLPGSMGEVSGSLPQLPQFPSPEERIGLDLSYLRLPAKSLLGDKPEGEGSTSFLSPSSLLPLDVSVEQLYLGNEPLGKWKFLLTASDTTALVHGIKASSHSLNISSDSDDGLLWAIDRQGKTISSLRTHVSSSDFGAFLTGIRGEQEQLPMTSEKMKADVSLDWEGAPEAIALGRVNGLVDFQFRDGQFYQAPQSATGILKLLGLINFDTLLRRVQLDFADVYKQGLSFDKIDGELVLEGKQLSFERPPIEMLGSSSRFRLSGKLDLESNTIDADLVATLPVANNLPWIAAIAGGLPGAAGAFVVKEVFGDQIEKLSSASYKIEGSLDDPKVNFDQLFDN